MGLVVGSGVHGDGGVEGEPHSAGDGLNHFLTLVAGSRRSFIGCK